MEILSNVRVQRGSLAVLGGARGVEICGEGEGGPGVCKMEMRICRGGSVARRAAPRGSYPATTAYARTL